MSVEAALQEDVRVIGLRILSGANMELFPQIVQGLKENQMDDVIVLAGGIIPEEDRIALEKMGIRGIFGPGTKTSDIIEFIREAVSEADKAGAD